MHKVHWKKHREEYRCIRGCAGKQRHPNRKVAQFYADKIEHPRINVYKCRFCGKWHVGKSAW